MSGGQLWLCRLQQWGLLLGRFFRCRQRRLAFPGMVGDIEHHAVRPVKLGLVERRHPRWPPCKAAGTELLKLVGEGVNVLNQNAEMMNAAEVEARPLIPAKPKDR